LRRKLDFIENDLGAYRIKEKMGIRKGLVSEERVIKTDILVFLEGLNQEGGLPRLPGAGDRQAWKGSKQAFHFGFDLSVDISHESMVIESKTLVNTILIPHFKIALHVCCF
jgi:hypothetical protein